MYILRRLLPILFLINNVTCERIFTYAFVLHCYLYILLIFSIIYTLCNCYLWVTSLGSSVSLWYYSNLKFLLFNKLLIFAGLMIDYQLKFLQILSMYGFPMHMFEASTFRICSISSVLSLKMGGYRINSFIIPLFVLLFLNNAANYRANYWLMFLLFNTSLILIYGIRFRNV